MRTIHIQNCPRCSTLLDKTISLGQEIRCKCKYWIDIRMNGNVECSFDYNGYFIWSSEKHGETGFSHDNNNSSIFWIKRVLDPFITNEQLDKIMLLI